MTVLRIKIEKDSKKGEYRWINLFANWCVHPEISKSDQVFEVFDTIYGALAQFDATKGKSMRGFYDLVFDKLRMEMRRLFLEQDIPTWLTDNQGAFMWFLIGMLLIINDRPIRVPGKLRRSQARRLGDIRGLMKNVRPDVDLTPISVRILHEPTSGTFDLHLITRGRKFPICLVLQTITYRNTALKCLRENEGDILV